MGLAGKPYSVGPICVPGPDSCVPDQTDQSKKILNFFSIIFIILWHFFVICSLFFFICHLIGPKFPTFLPSCRGAVVVACLLFVFVFVCFLFVSCFFFFNTLLLLLLLSLLCFLAFVWVCLFVWVCSRPYLLFVCCLFSFRLFVFRSVCSSSPICLLCGMFPPA